MADPNRDIDDLHLFYIYVIHSSYIHTDMDVINHGGSNNHDVITTIFKFSRYVHSDTDLVRRLGKINQHCTVV